MSGGDGGDCTSSVRKEILMSFEVGRKTEVLVPSDIRREKGSGAASGGRRGNDKNGSSELQDGPS